MLIKASSTPAGAPQATQEQPETPNAGVWKGFQRKWGYLKGQKGFIDAPFMTSARLLVWWMRSFLHWSATISLNKWDAQMFLPAAWRGIGKLLFAFREHYEPELCYLEHILSPGKIFVDVGACYGIYTLAASRIVGERGRVIAFEPALRAFRVLRENIVLNRLTNTLAYPLALTEKRGKARLFHHPNTGCDSLGRDSSFTEVAEEVDTESLDTVLRENSIDHVDAIKMDVQGAEELVLLGATKTLSASRPIVIFEVYPPCTIPLGLPPYGAWKVLESLGYKFFAVNEHGTLQEQQSPPTDCNVIAVHKQAPMISETTVFTSAVTEGPAN